MKSRTGKRLLLVIVLVLVMLQGVAPTPAAATPAAGPTCWTTAYGFGVGNGEHSNFLRVAIPHNDFWRVRSIYYDGERVGPYNTVKVSGDRSSSPGNPYTDLRVASRWAGFPWPWIFRDKSQSHWKVDYLCYK